MTYEKILNIYESTKDTELEFRFQIKNREMFKNIILNIDGDKTIEQSINFISPSSGSDRICKLLFLNGVKKTSVYMTKHLVEKTSIAESILPYKLTLSCEKIIPKFNINLSKFARIKLRLSVRTKELPDWRLDFTLVKTVNDIKNNLKKDKTNMLFNIDTSNFTSSAPWEYSDTLELEAEHVSDNKNITEDELDNVINYVMSVTDSDYMNTFEYQKRVYQIAKYIVNKKDLYKFKQNNSTWLLYNKVIELNKASYYNNIFSNISNFYVLHKADGIRTLAIIEGEYLYALVNTLQSHKLNKKYTKPTILDAEFVNGKYYIFDVIVFDGVNVANTPTSERIQHIPDIIDMCDGYVLEKDIISLTQNYREELVSMYSGAKDLPYLIDGIIFTPKDGLYSTMKSWKWKPLEHMSIDFLVKLPKNLTGIKPYLPISGHTMLFLFSGISKQLYDKLRLNTVAGYDKMFPQQKLYRYFPIQFSPSDDPYAYIYYHPDDSKIPLKDIVNNVCEFRRVDLDKKPKWDIMRVRTDRKADLNKGNYFGNGFYVAEYTWQNYQNPLKFEDLIISNEEFIDRGYFKEEKSSLYKALTGFNSFVKYNLIEKYNGSNWLVDMAAGKGQDLFRVSNAKIKNALFLDKDPQALAELISRKHDFQRGIKRLNSKVYTKQVDLTNDFREVVESINSIGIRNQSIDVMMCNFAIHYLTNTPASVRNVIQLIDTLLKKGGHFFFTSFDGEKVFDLLKDKKSYDLREGEVLKYSIKKKYTSDRFEAVGQKIDVLLPFSAGNYYTENLVNYNYLQEEFVKYGFKLHKKGTFSSYLSKFKENKLYKALSDVDIEFISLYSYCIFKKSTPKKGQDDDLVVVK